MRAVGTGRRLAVRRLASWGGALGLVALAAYAIILNSRLGEITHFRRLVDDASETYQSAAMEAMSSGARRSLVGYLEESQDLRGHAELHLAGLETALVERNGIRVNGVSVRLVTMVGYGTPTPSLYVRLQGATTSVFASPRVTVTGSPVQLRSVPLAWWLGAYAHSGELSDVVDGQMMTVGEPRMVAAAAPSSGGEIAAYFAAFVPTPAYQLHVFQFGRWQGSVAVWGVEHPERPRLRLFGPAGVVEQDVRQRLL